MGTAPRSPAMDTKANQLAGSRKGAKDTRVAKGRARTTRATPATAAGIRASDSWSGVASRPNMMNSPICAAQASPSANPITDRRWGNSSADPTRTAAT